MSVADRWERTRMALNGGRPRPVPVSVWFHFDPSEVAGQAMAQAHLSHLNKYDLDYLKVMNDNPYDMPGTLPVVESPSDWPRLEPLGPGASGFRAQLEGLRVLVRDLKGSVFFTTTIFNVFATAQKISGGRLLEHLRTDPEAVQTGLATIARSLATLARECIWTGADGIFLACSGNASGELNSSDYARLIRRHDETILNAAHEGTFNFVHAHGDGIDLGLFTDLSAHCLSWNSRRNSLSLAQARLRTAMCLVGGWDQEGPIAHGPVDAIVTQTRDALRQTHGQHLLLGPGCTIPSDTPAKWIHAALDASRREVTT